ncbi:hypothetical protein F0562_007337 [Nyssa sinensis]|uniref:Uncharacterized protein n=1 Tax=Nyssa sinensis TaxID=561372 RepID=A0A5J5A6K4_9ASTE|nr:hypothetical protein F0562_007337 [Nyssa sinensis]
MAMSATLHAPSSFQQSEFFALRRDGEQKRFSLMIAPKRKGHSSWIIKSVLQKRNSSVDDNGPTEPAMVLLERLFAKTQKLEEQMCSDSHLPQDAQSVLDLGILESDLLAALEALKMKEEYLQDAERKVLLEHTELKRAKEELERREEEIAAACSKKEKLEEELKQANLNLVSQATKIEDLQLQLKERDQEISAAQSALSLKEDEIKEMKNELMKKSEEAANIECELKSKAQLLNEANEIVKKQEVEVQELRNAIQAKEKELEVSVTLRKVEEGKLKVAEANLEKRTMEWLLAQEEVKKLADEASKHAGEANETLEDLRRVKKLLSDVRSELVLSQKALASSRRKMEDQEQLLEKQLIELEEQKRSVVSYLTSLKDAQIEVESERAKFRVAEARNKELERDLSMEKELIEDLQGELNKERSSLQQAIKEMSSIQEELDRKSTEFGETRNVLQVKESEMVEARLEIQHLKSEHAALQLMLEERDLELFNARKKLEEVNEEIAELRMLMSSREDQHIQATAMLTEKEEHVQTMQHELNDTKLKISEAESVVERIVELTNKMLTSVKHEDYDGMSMFDYMEHKKLHQLSEKPTDDFKWQKKQLEAELEFTRESLRTKEMEVLAAQRALTIKDEELKMLFGRLDSREKEIKELKEEMTQDANDLRKLYALAQERIGGKSIGDLAIEKLQLEAAQLEVAAATSALHKLTEMSRELLNKASLSVEADSDTSIFLQNGSDPSVLEHNECLSEVKSEVARLSALTEQLMKEAGIVGDVN